MTAELELEHEIRAAQEGLTFAFLVFRSRLRAWIWDSREGRGLLRELQGWASRNNLPLRPYHHAELATVLEAYLNAHYEQAFLARCVSWLIHPIFRAEKIKEGLAYLVEVNTALVEVVEKPVAAAWQPLQKVGEIVSQFPLFNFFNPTNLLTHQMGENGPTIETYLQERYQTQTRSPILSWFGVLNQAIRRIWEEIQRYRERMVSMEDKNISKPSEIFHLTHPEGLAHLKNAIEDYFRGGDEGEEGDSLSWEENMVGKIDENLSWSCLTRENTRSMTPAEFLQQEAFLRKQIECCLREIYRDYFSTDRADDSQLLSSRIEYLLKLLWDAKHLRAYDPSASLFRRIFSGDSGNRVFWNRLDAFQRALLNLSDRTGTYEKSLSFSILAQTFSSILYGSVWISENQRGIKNIYQGEWAFYLQRYHEWIKENNGEDPQDISIQEKKRQLQLECSTINRYFFESTRVLYREQAEKVQVKLKNRIEEFSQILSKDNSLFIPTSQNLGEDSDEDVAGVIPQGGVSPAALILVGPSSSSGTAPSYAPPLASALASSAQTFISDKKDSLPYITIHDAYRGDHPEELKRQFLLLGFGEYERIRVDEFKRRARRAIANTHPDKHPDHVQEATEKFKEMGVANEAWHQVIEKILTNIPSNPAMAEWRSKEQRKHAGWTEQHEEALREIKKGIERLGEKIVLTHQILDRFDEKILINKESAARFEESAARFEESAQGLQEGLLRNNEIQMATDAMHRFILESSKNTDELIRKRREQEMASQQPSSRTSSPDSEADSSYPPPPSSTFASSSMHIPIAASTASAPEESILFPPIPDEKNGKVGKRQGHLSLPPPMTELLELSLLSPPKSVPEGEIPQAPEKNHTVFNTVSF